MRRECCSVLWGVFALVAMLPLNGCESDNPAAQPVRPQPLRKSWSAERQVFAYAIPNECPDGGCGEVWQPLPVDLGPGTHLVRVRISGTITFEGPDCRSLHDARLGPMGIPWYYLPEPEYHTWNYIGYSLLFSRVWWQNGAASYTELDMQPVTADSSVIEGEAEVYGSGKGIYLVRSMGISGFLTCHTVGDVQLQVFVRDQVQQEAKLVLTCTGDLGENKVTRGRTVHCEARKDPASASGELTVTTWSFEGEARTDEPLTATTWEGLMVRPGTVTVKARIGTGAEQTATATIAVQPRIWSTKAPTIAAHHVPNGDQHTDPRLPEAVTWAHDLGHTRFWPENDETVQIQKGPNRDYYYFGDVKFSVGAYYSLNDEAFKPNSAFTLAQAYNTGASGAVSRLGGMNYCQQRDVPGAATRVDAHENEHIRVYREQFTKVVRPEYDRLEQMYGKSESVLTDAVDQIRTRADREAAAESERVVDNVNGPYVVKFFDSSGHPCMMKNVRGADLVNQP